jgi:hypothetical protein
VERIPPDNWIYEVDLHEPADIDGELMAWLREAYEIGAQRHPAQSRYRTAPAGAEPRASGGATSYGAREHGRRTERAGIQEGDPDMGDKTPKRPPKPKKDKKAKSATV